MPLISGSMCDQEQFTITSFCSWVNNAFFTLIVASLKQLLKFNQSPSEYIDLKHTGPTSSEVYFENVDSTHFNFMHQHKVDGVPWRWWFKLLFLAKESDEISRECWPHAEALTCMHVFQDCDPVSKKSTKPTLCSEHCRLMKRHICKGEYKRVIHSDYMQQFIPLCEQISIIDDSNGEFCYFLPTFNMSLGIYFAFAYRSRYSKMDQIFKGCLR